MKERIKWYLIKVMESCETEEQEDVAFEWAKKIAIKHRLIPSFINIEDMSMVGFCLYMSRH